MSFEVCYTGDATTYMVAASTPERKGDEFYDKMDALSKEYKQLTTDSEAIREKMVDAVKEAGNKVLSDKYPDGQYEIDYFDGDCIADNSLEKKQEAKAEEMLELCREYFTDEAKIEGFGEIDGGDGFEMFNSSGEIDVDGKDIDMGEGWDDAFEEHESEPYDLWMKLQEQDWHVLYYVQNKSSWSATIEEDEFDKEKLHWKNSKVYYGDTPIENDEGGARPVAENISLIVGKGEYDF